MGDEVDNAVRVAVLENQVHHLESKLEAKDKEIVVRLNEDKADFVRRMEALEMKMDEVLLAHSRYRGAWGMLLMITSALWAGVVFLKDIIWKGKA